MLKIIYPVCCGIDVHKSFVFACIASTNSQGVTAYKSKRFSTFTKDLRFCASWLAENNCKNVCMETIRAKSNPEIRSRYLSIKKRRGHKKAIIAML